MSRCTTATLVLPFLLAVLSSRGGLAKVCLKNSDIGPEEGNMYQCDDPELSRCCVEGETFTCCESATKKTLRDQLTIWGVIIVFVVAVLIISFCFRKDIYCFESDTLKQSIQSVFGVCRWRKYKTSPKEDKEKLIYGRQFNGIANLGEPDADEYVKNYLISETYGDYYARK